MKGRFLVQILLLLLSFTAVAEDLMDMIGKDFHIFSEDRPRFIKPSNARYFRWMSDEKKAVRYNSAGRRNKLTFFGQPVAEVIVYFEENSVSRIYISIYNRGDNQQISTEEFYKISKEIYRNLKALYPNERHIQRKEKIGDGKFVNAVIWRGEKYSCRMLWSISGKTRRSEKPEYLQVEFEPFNPSSDPATRPLMRADRTKIAARENLPENVQRKSNGDVYIDNIPMVDQGRKGYCVAAVLERVLRYYNVPVTQHIIAQLCGTSAERGTSTDVMVKVMENASGKFGIRIRDEYDLFGKKRAIGTLKELLSDYNRLARKKKKPEQKMVIRNRTVYLDETIYNLDPEIYAQVRNDDSEFRKFHQTIVRNVNSGIPVIWCVLLGIMPEDKLSSQSKGGHMRLIIGYNEKNQEILYTDSWGMGHELKSMPIQHAWAITTRVFYMIPRARKMY